MEADLFRSKIIVRDSDDPGVRTLFGFSFEMRWDVEAVSVASISAGLVLIVTHSTNTL